MKKKLFLSTLFIVLIIIVYSVAAKLFPMYASRLPIFFILLLMDLYLWFPFKRWIQAKKLLNRQFLAKLFWLPFVLFVGFFAFTAIYPFADNQRSLRTYWLGLIIIIYISKLFPFAFFLLSDLLYFIKKAVNHIFKKPLKEKTGRSKILIFMGIFWGSIAFVGLFVGMTSWAYNFKVKKEVIHLVNLPEAFDGLRIVQISDMHLGSWTSTKSMQRAVKMINELNPDLVFFTGDLVSFQTNEAYPFENQLKKIKSKYGVFSVLGNHDYGDYSRWDSPEAKTINFNNLIDFQKRIGWTLLNNQNFLIYPPGVDTLNKKDAIAIIGVENWSSHTRFKKNGNLGKALSGTENVPFKLLLSHDPTHWEKQVCSKYKDIDITFSGHTHGMQMGIEFWGIKWSPAQWMYKYWAGLYSSESCNKKQYLYVNRGLGNIAYPGRVGMPPEITLIELKKSN